MAKKTLGGLLLLSLGNYLLKAQISCLQIMIWMSLKIWRAPNSNGLDPHVPFSNGLFTQNIHYLQTNNLFRCQDTIHVVVLGALPFGHWTMIHNWRLLPHDIAAPRRAVLRQVIPGSAI